MANRLTPRIISKIRLLRKKGWSLNEIKDQVPVGYGTIFRYIKGVQILPQHKTTWFGKRGGSIKRKKRLEEQAYLKAKNTIRYLTDNERIIFLTALYWSEGTKKDFSLTNSDPELIKIFVDGLVKVFKTDRSKFRVSVRIYEDLDRAKCLDHWSEIIGIPPAKFISVNVLKGKKVGKLKYGICRVRLEKGGNMLKYLNSLKNRVIEMY
jgi:hypothetical protein